MARGVIVTAPVSRSRRAEFDFVFEKT